MARRSKGLKLEVRASFDAGRIAPQCLAEAYERLVPIPRRPTRAAAPVGAPPSVASTTGQPGWRRVEGG